MDLRAILVYSGLAVFILLFVVVTYWLTNRGTLHYSSTPHELNLPMWGWYLLAFGMWWFIWLFWLNQFWVLAHHNVCTRDYFSSCLTVKWRIIWIILIAPSLLLLKKPKRLVWIWMLILSFGQGGPMGNRAGGGLVGASDKYSNKPPKTDDDSTVS